MVKGQNASTKGEPTPQPTFRGRFSPPVAPPLGKSSEKKMVAKLSATIHGASSTHRTTTPENVLDGNPDSAWNSGTHPVGWITLDLGNPCTLTKVRLLPEMTPKICHVIHKVKVGYESDKLKTIWTLDAECKSQEWIEMDAPSGTVARYVQIYTEESSSWLSWRLIEAYGSPDLDGVTPFFS